jgi:hypothetical protein
MSHNATFDMLSVSEFKVAYIMGVHFRAGEWGHRPRCGSVITCVIHGVSLYARVERFLRIDGDDCPGYASVTWFGRPRYLFGAKTPLGVCCALEYPEIDRELGSVIRITQIDPTPIMVECAGDNYMMMRDRGWDTREHV